MIDRDQSISNPDLNRLRSLIYERSGINLAQIRRRCSNSGLSLASAPSICPPMPPIAI